jgi:hypothetical protein
MDAAVFHYYKKYRGNLEHPMLDAYWSARRHVHFRERLAKMVAKPKRRRKRAHEAVE